MPFTDIIEGNSNYAAHYDELPSGKAARGLAVVTCIDSRIAPLAALGLDVGDAKILRSAGARVTDDVLRGLIISAHALGVTRIALMQHTDCGVAGNTQESLTSMVRAATGEDASDFDFMTIDDQALTLAADAELIRECKFLPPGIEIGTFIYDVHSGKVTQLS